MIDCSRTENYIAEKLRMTKERSGAHYMCICKHDCTDCPLGIKNNGKSVTCTDLEVLYPEKAIEIVQKWSNEHPPKTYLSELLKAFPNSPLNTNGIPKLCPHHLGLINIDDCRPDRDCAKCWNQSIEENKK